MSGFSGILVFNDAYHGKLKSFDVPRYVNRFYKKKNETKEDTWFQTNFLIESIKRCSKAFFSRSRMKKCL